jgi:casein kinase II regulatory subunit
MLSEAQQETIGASAEVLYGLIHSRYVLTAQGLAAMVRAFLSCCKCGVTGPPVCAYAVLVSMGVCFSFSTHSHVTPGGEVPPLRLWPLPTGYV